MRPEKNVDEIVRRQFRKDTNCPVEMEGQRPVKINIRKDIEGARVTQGMSSFFKAVIYRGEAYIMADERILDWTRETYSQAMPEWFCKYENLRKLDKKLNEYGHEIADTHVYMLPDSEAIENEYEGERSYQEKWMYEKEIEEWLSSYGEDNPCYHALAGSKTQPDRIGFLLTEGNAIAGMSGVSEDCADLWQIGVDVMPDYSGRGLATYMTDMMKRKVLSIGHIPFYGTSESHSLSMDTGIRAGFLPAWAEVYVRKI